LTPRRDIRQLGEEERTSELKTGVPDGANALSAFPRLLVAPSWGRISAGPGGLQLCELAVLSQCINRCIDGIAKIRTLRGIGDPKPLMSGHLHRDREVWSLARCWCGATLPRSTIILITESATALDDLEAGHIGLVIKLFPVISWLTVSWSLLPNPSDTNLSSRHIERTRAAKLRRYECWCDYSRPTVSAR
jgi:hypothetical protein